MDLTLARSAYRLDGVFGELYETNSNDKIAVTCEHAYTDDLGGYYPKILPGEYLCKRGIHQLKNMPRPFETFQIMNVPNHTQILFHVGNWHFDSDGCVLLGSDIAPSSRGQMITNSRMTFDKFMLLQSGLEFFQLKVLA